VAEDFAIDVDLAISSVAGGGGADAAGVDAKEDRQNQNDRDCE